MIQSAIAKNEVIFLLLRLNNALPLNLCGSQKITFRDG